MDLNSRKALIEDLLAQAYQKLTESLKDERQVNSKSKWNDLVTDMDKSMEKYLVDHINHAFPNDAIFAEEEYNNSATSLSGPVWYIDPIDGTLNYIFQQKDFAVMMAFYVDGIGQMGYILDMNTGDIYSAIKDQGLYKNGHPYSIPFNRGIKEGLVAFNTGVCLSPDYEHIRQIGREAVGVRMNGSAGQHALEIVKGHSVAYLASRLGPWDIAAAQVILTEAGFCCFQFDGQPLDMMEKKSAIFASQKASQEISDLLGIKPLQV